MVRPLLEYVNTIWSSRRVSDLTGIKKVQMKATKYVRRNKHLLYEDRLRYFKLPTLNYRIIITGKYDSNFGLWVYLCSDTVHASVTEGNNFKLVPPDCKYDLRIFY